MPYEWLHEMSDADALAVARYLQSLAPVRNEVRQSPNLWFKLGKIFLLRPKPFLSASAPAPGPTEEYGGYLARHVGLCGECHTPRSGLRSAPDMNRLFAGMPKPPKGFPANPSNLTPDEATGIGKWSEEDFIRTLRTGVNPTGHAMSPFMPWPEIKRMSDDDLRSIYRYLRALPPIHNAVPRNGSG
jgi:mono/diheme cytochrome c family protein